MRSIYGAENNYSRQVPLKIGFGQEQSVSSDFLRLNNIPPEIARPPGSPWITVPAGRRSRRRRERKQKRGCRAGVLVRLRKRPHKPPLPSIFFTNARSLVNKMDELRLQVAVNKNTKDSCILMITETWLHSLITDSVIQLAGYPTHHQDRTSNSGKSRGGGLCVYVNNTWCTKTVIIDRHYSPDLEYLTIKCRPTYLPIEFNAVLITAVYIPPNADAKVALGLLHSSISSQQSRYADAVFVIAGDFNHADLKAVLPKFHQHVKRGANTLDKVYSNIKKGYKVRPLPHLAQSDHLCLLSVPAYTPLRKTDSIITRTVKIWQDGAT